MPSLAATTSNLRQLLRAAVNDAKDLGGRTFETVRRPKRLQAAADGATRVGQVIAFLLVGPVIMVSLTILRVINDLMTSMLLGQDLSGQEGILGWLVTFLSLCLLCVAGWGWFQFVRTAAFGGLSFD